MGNKFLGRLITKLPPARHLHLAGKYSAYVANPSARQKRRAMQQMNSNRCSGNKGKNQGITFMLVMACLMFLLTTLPINIYMLCQQYAKDTKEDVMSVARGELTYTLFSLLYYVNNAVNFAIYFLSGPVFRRAAMEVFCKKCIAARCAVNGSTQRTHMSAMTTIRSRGDMNLRQETVKKKL